MCHPLCYNGNKVGVAGAGSRGVLCFDNHYVTGLRHWDKEEIGVDRTQRRMKVSCEAGEGGSLGRAWKHMSWLYYQYLLVTALYMLEPWERTIFNSMLVSIVGMALYTGYIFMPQHILAILHYFEIVQ